MARGANKTDHIATLPIFSACSKKELQKIAKATVEIQVPAGKEFVTQGDVGREAFIVVDGEASVRRNDRKVATLGPGTAIGEMALLDKGPRTASVVADTDMTLLVLGSREFAGVLDEVPSMARKMLKVLSQRVRDLDSKAFG